MHCGRSSTHSTVSGSLHAQDVHRRQTIKKKDIFDPIEDDDDIDWKYNPFDVDLIDETVESPEQLMSQITFEGSPKLQKRLKALVLEFIDVRYKGPQRTRSS